MKPQPKTLRPSWDETQSLCACLARRLAEKGDWRGIVAVTRGGMVPAAIVARHLDIRMIETFSVVSYAADPDGENPRQSERLEVLKPAFGVGDGAGWLVIDDLADSGRTMAALRQAMPKAHFAALYAKPEGKSSLDTFAAEADQETWIYFPWEMQ